VQFSFRVLFAPKALLSSPVAQPSTLCSVRQSPPLRHLSYDFGSPSILSQSTSWWWLPVLIHPLLDHTFLVDGLGLHDDVNNRPSHPRRQLPSRALTLKLISVPPSSRSPESVHQSTTSLLWPHNRTSRVSTTSGSLTAGTTAHSG
jgi:hypothetical protein